MSEVGAILPAMRPSHRCRTALLILLAWAVPVALATTQTVVRALDSPDGRIGWGEALLFQMPLWLPLLILAPLVLAVTQRLAVDGARPVRSLVAQFLVALFLAMLYLSLSAAISVLVEQRPLTGASFLSAGGQLAVRTFHLDLFIIAALMFAGHAIKNRRRAEAEQLRASQLRAELSGARLSALKAQLHPHFLFNTLHAISSLVEEDVDTAREMIAALSDLLRHTLEGSSAQEVELGEELQMIDLYLAIERIRFQDRLHLVRNVAPETLAALVPSLLLQPLVENAMVHGVAERDEPSVVEISSRGEAGRLMIEVVNDEAPTAPRRKRGSGVGLINTRARLRRLHGELASLELSAAEGKMRARVTLPLRFEERK